MPDVVDRRGTVAVVGAGSSGLAAAKNLREHGFRVEVLERNDDVGGNWYFGTPSSRVYRSTHTISSPPFTQFPDFPMPDHYPPYPHHEQLFAYFQRYARHFGLYDVIEFETTVTDVTPSDERVGTVPDGPRWDVTLIRGEGPPETRRYDAVVVANGHNWFPKWPSYPGLDGFTGQVLHSADYRDPEPLRDRRVLVVGGGNTGCDLAVEAAQHAAEAHHSTRRGYWYTPKFVFGRPADQVSDVFFALRLPTRVIQWIFERTSRVTVGDLTRYGLRAPDHRMLETHPIVNSSLLYHVAHGDVTPRPDIDRFEGDEVVFTDGARIVADVVVFCTGYLIRFPFLDDAHVNLVDGRPRLYRNVFHPELPNLAVVGLLQPDSGQFKLVHWQAVAVARYLRAQRDRPEVARRFARRIRDHLDDTSRGGVRLVDSTRHYVEVEHMDYLRALEADINRELAPA